MTENQNPGKESSAAAASTQERPVLVAEGLMQRMNLSERNPAVEASSGIHDDNDGKIRFKEAKKAYDRLCAAAASGDTDLSELESHFVRADERGWVQHHIGEIANLAFRHDLRALQRYTAERFSLCSDHRVLAEVALVGLLQHPNLTAKASVVWSRVLDWCAHQSDVSTVREEWGTRELAQMQQKLQGFVDLVPFKTMSKKYFRQHVVPYSEILPSDLFQEMAKLHGVDEQDSVDRPNVNPQGTKSTTTATTANMRPRTNMPPNGASESEEMPLETALDSVILDDSKAALIASWVDMRKLQQRGEPNYTPHTNPYVFKLILRASRDGYDALAFRQRCRNKPRTVVVVRLERITDIVGGYNPISWTNEVGYGSTDASFIFNLGSPLSGQPKVSYVQLPYRAVYNSKEAGPAFGKGDLKMMEDGMWSRARKKNRDNQYTYEEQVWNGERVASAIEYEVFRLVENVDNSGSSKSNISSSTSSSGGGGGGTSTTTTTSISNGSRKS